MDYLSQDEDLQFYDANEEIMASSPSGFDFGLWNDSPGSVVERRRKFLEWMGIEEDCVKSENSVDVIEESGFSGAPENYIGSGGFTSSSSEVSLCDSSVEVSEVSSVTRRKSSSMVSCSNFVHCQVKETEKQSNIAGILMSIKKGWLTTLQSMRKIESGGRIKPYDDVISRVKVKHHRKQEKELSALYQIQDIKAHNGSILAMKFSGDGKYLASSGEDGIVRVWKVMEYKKTRLQRDRLTEINRSCMYFEVNESSQLKPVLLDEDKPNKTSESFKKTSDSACVVFPPKVFRLMDKPVHEFHGHTGEVLDISWSKDNHLLSASTDKTVRIWKVGSNACLGVFPHNSYVTSVQFNPVNKNYFMSGSIDGKVRIWNISRCNVVDWIDLKDMISAVCYRPDGQGGIIGSLTGNCRFFNMSGEYLELEPQIHLHNKKKSSKKRITRFQFIPQDPSKVVVVYADHKVRILQSNKVVKKSSGVCNLSSSLTSDGKHIVSACDDNVYIWNNDEDSDSSSQTKKIRSFERFATNASVATTWCSSSDHSYPLPFSSPLCSSLDEGFVSGLISKGSATWPEEKLPVNPLSTSAMTASHYKFLKSSYQRAASSLAWGMVIVTGGWDGRIRTFHNYGLPVIT